MTASGKHGTASNRISINSKSPSHWWQGGGRSLLIGRVLSPHRKRIADGHFGLEDRRKLRHPCGLTNHESTAVPCSNNRRRFTAPGCRVRNQTFNGGQIPLRITRKKHRRVRFPTARSNVRP